MEDYLENTSSAGMNSDLNVGKWQMDIEDGKPTKPANLSCPEQISSH